MIREGGGNVRGEKEGFRGAIHGATQAQSWLRDSQLSEKRKKPATIKRKNGKKVVRRG